ncbi:MAG: hypothetical protein K0S88_7059 [Actinomycetia bacterium]|nr:hypothetical protein [Actinomycetes bacterium]
MAIKGKSKRSQGRPVRRPATGPRIQTVERRLPWYRAPAFPVTLAVIALLGTLIAAANRVQEGPGFPSAQELATGKLKGNQLAVRASGWSAKLGQIQGRVESITVGEAPADAGTDGEPANAVGGRVPMLTSVRDSYAAAIEMYFEAANAYQKAGEASGKTAASLIEEGTAIATTAGKSMDAAAGALARIHARYGLDLTRQMPGESSEAFGARYSGAAPTANSILPPN